MNSNLKDMTTGSPAKLISLFALPMMLGNIFQQLYTMTDALIVGQFAGADALGAIGVCDWLTWLVFGVISALTQGFSILVAQRFGAGDMRALRRAVSTIIYLTIGTIVVFTAIGLATVTPMLRITNAPENLMPMAQQYLYILYGGIAITTLYNMLSCLLRALGNSRVPLYAMVAAAIVNIGLDLLFVIAFKWSVLGAAIATVIAQAVSVVICLASVLRTDALRITRQELVYDKSDAKHLLKLAAPMAFQNLIICIGGVAVQAVINSLGSNYVSGFTATNKMYGLLEIAAVSYGYAVNTFVGQNLGARKYDRIRKGTRIGAIIGLLFSLVITVAFIFLNKPVLRLFINAEADPMILEVASIYLKFMTWPLFILYMLHIYRSALQGMGDTVIPMISGIVECIMRIGCAWILTAIIGATGIYYAEPAAWLGAAVILVSAYYYRAARLEKTFDGTAI